MNENEIFFGDPAQMRCWKQNDDGTLTEYRLRWEPVKQQPADRPNVERAMTGIVAAKEQLPRMKSLLLQIFPQSDAEASAREASLETVNAYADMVETTERLCSWIRHLEQGSPEADRLRAALVEIASLDYRECDDSDDDALCSGAREAAKLAREALARPNEKCPACGGRNVTIEGSLMTCHDCASDAKPRCEECSEYEPTTNECRRVICPHGDKS